MKFSIVRTDKKGAVHLSVKPAEWFMEHIKSETKAQEVSRLRTYVANFGKADSYDRVGNMARVFPAVEMAKAQNGRLDIIAFNSLVTLHVGDLLKKELLTAVKEAAQMLPMTLAAMDGADGRSVDILVAVARKDRVMPKTETDMDVMCRQAYEVAVKVYGSILPKPIERQPVSARSSFLVTLDEHPYYNPQPIPLTVEVEWSSTTEPGATPTTEEQRETDMMLYSDYELMYKRAAEEALQETDGVIDSQWTEAYLTELSRRLCEAGMPEEEAALHLRNHHKYKKEYDEDTLRAIVAAVYAEYKPQRAKDGSTISRQTRQLINFLTTRYVFRYNTVMGYTEYRPNNTWIQNWQPCDENVINGMTIKARLANLDVRDKDVRRYVRSNMIRQCNPVEDYLLKVSKRWDGETDHIAMLARTVPCELPQWELWFKKWFVAMVAQWVLPAQEYGNSVVPLLISSQGDGKTSFCRNLLPKELRWGFQESQDISEKRQTLQTMHNFLLINLDEFNQISPKLQEGFLKNIIQLPNVKIKRPYGKHVEEFKRYASFIATTNQFSVLSDPTGSRRFICVHLTAPIDTTYRPNYEALYGQAYRIVTERLMDWWFTAEEVEQVMAHNKQYQIVPPAVMFFHEYYEAVADEADGEWMSVTAIYENLRSVAGAGLKANGVATFGKYLRMIPGLRQNRISKGMVYLVKRKK